MNQRVAVYTVRVRPKRDLETYRPLGDIDDQGTSLMSILLSYMEDFESVSADETRSVRGGGNVVDQGEVLLMLLHGQTGMAADIVDKVGDLRLRQSADDTSRVRCGCLIRLPTAADIGWLASHINNGRHTKGLLEKGIQELFRQQFRDFVLEIKPYVMGSVLQRAVQQGRIDKIRLVKLERPDDRALTGAGKWVVAGTTAKAEMILTPRGRLNRILSDLPQRFLGGDQGVFGEIVQYEGITFDEAKLEVELDDGTHRTFNIERPDAGHAFTEDLRNVVLDDGEPTEASLLAALRQALTTFSVGG
jgi:hypothetical protein